MSFQCRSIRDDDPNSPITDKQLYLSKVMSLMFLTKRTRPDIHKVVSFLSAKCEHPTKAHMDKLDRVCKYD